MVCIYIWFLVTSVECAICICFKRADNDRVRNN